MSYIVVVDYLAQGNICRCAMVSDDFSKVVPVCDLNLGSLGSYTKSVKAEPLNFSVDTYGRVAQNRGSFKRFSPEGSAVIVAELKSRKGMTLGYRLLSCKGLQLVNLKTEDILARESSRTSPFLQNAIVRNNAVCCYPHSSFPVVTIDLKPKQRNNEKMKEPVKPHRPAKKPETSRLKELNEAQKTEVARCLAAGVDPSLIRNPDLSSDQMRVLWVSKSKGALAEYYSSPEFSTESMKFYADRLMSKKIANECEGMLEHPDLSVDQLSELYRCVCEGVDYSDLLDKSAVEINIEREKQCREYWGDEKQLDDADYYIKAVNAAMKMQMGV